MKPLIWKRLTVDVPEWMWKTGYWWIDEGGDAPSKCNGFNGANKACAGVTVAPCHADGSPREWPTGVVEYSCICGMPQMIVISDARKDEKHKRVRAALVRLLWNLVADDADCTCEDDDECAACSAFQALGLGRWPGSEQAATMLGGIGEPQ